MAEEVLTVRQVQTAGDADHSDGCGLMLRVRGESASWVLRYTAPSGRRRQMGLGVARRGTSRECGESLAGARDGAAKARSQLQQGLDPSKSVAAPRRLARLPKPRRRCRRSASSSRWRACPATITNAWRSRG